MLVRFYPIRFDNFLLPQIKVLYVDLKFYCCLPAEYLNCGHKERERMDQVGSQLLLAFLVQNPTE